LQIFWAILKSAGFEVNEGGLRAIAPNVPNLSVFSPGFKKDFRAAAYGDNTPPASINTIDELIKELRIINAHRRSTKNDENFDPDEVYLLEFLDPLAGRAGTSLLSPFRKFHNKEAGNFEEDILNLLDDGKTVILDLGNADDILLKYFSDSLSSAVLNHQVNKFSNNDLGDHYIQLYFEEAHNLFPKNSSDVTTIYNRFAKEGAKYHIGMVYSTQSPTTVSKDLLAQTENFFIAHLSSREEVEGLAKLNIAYESLKSDILSAKTPGFIRMLTRSHRFAIPVQANRFKAIQRAE
jgi:DNA helicase HerA-like ATPase